MMNMLVVILTYGLTLSLFLRRGHGRREAVLASSIICGIIVVILTEALSALHQLGLTGLRTGWWISLAVIVAVLYFSGKSQEHKFSPEVIPLTARIFMAGIGAIFLLSAWMALSGPPTTWDAMSYHLSRVEHWVQNKTIAYYPTNIPRQDSYPPGAEWVLLHLRILSAGDYFARSLQCLAMMASTIGVSLIARLLGSGVTGQCLAALMSACLPMGILQSTSTQNDYVVTMWLVSFVYFILNAIKNPRPLQILLAAFSLGLAFLTKGYAYLYALPFLIYWLLACRSRAWLYRLGVTFFILGIALFLNAGYFYRNWHA